MKSQAQIKLPYLVTTKEGLNYVEFQVVNTTTGKLQRVRNHSGFKDLHSTAEIVDHANKIITELSEKLKSGWRPYDKSQYIYNDEVEYINQSRSFPGQKKDRNHLRNHLSKFLEFIKNNVSPKTYQSYQSKTRIFSFWLENQGYQDILIGQIDNKITIKFFEYLINDRKLDSVTIKKYKQNLFSMFSYLKENKLIKEIPLKDIPKSTKKIDAAARPMTDADVKKYLEYVSQHDKQLFLASVTQLLLLCRPNREMRLMKIQDINLSKALAYIRSDVAKTVARVLTMPTALVEIMSQYDLDKYPADYYIFGTGGKPGPKCVGVNHFNLKFSEIKNKLGFPSTYKFYSFKHTGAGKLMESGASLSELMSHLGHTRFESTIHYVRRHFGEKSEKIVNFKPDFLNGL